MNPSRLVLREIAHRKLNFLLGAACVALTVSITFGAMALLKAHDLETRAILADHDTRTEAILAQMESDTSQNMDQLEDAIRKSMKGLGFNIFIYPKEFDIF